jgi:hypothetical protein
VIKSGDQFIAWRGAFAGVAPAHIFHAAGTHNLRAGDLACKVVGLLLSVNMHTWNGIAISAEMIREIAARKS